MELSKEDVAPMDAHRENIFQKKNPQALQQRQNQFY